VVTTIIRVSWVTGVAVLLKPDFVGMAHYNEGIKCLICALSIKLRFV
jgi:hypothetical protein